MHKFGIGRAVSRFEDPRLLRGGGRYVDEMVLPGMAFDYVHVLRSPHAHAHFRAVDVTAAEAAPGVLAVLTGADWHVSGWDDLPVPAVSSGATDAPVTGRATRRWCWTGRAMSAMASPSSWRRPTTVRPMPCRRRDGRSRCCFRNRRTPAGRRRRTLARWRSTAAIARPMCPATPLADSKD